MKTVEFNSVCIGSALPGTTVNREQTEHQQLLKMISVQKKPAHNTKYESIKFLKLLFETTFRSLYRVLQNLIYRIKETHILL
jgi:hypothetical protein